MSRLRPRLNSLEQRLPAPGRLFVRVGQKGPPIDRRGGGLTLHLTPVREGTRELFPEFCHADFTFEADRRLYRLSSDFPAGFDKAGDAIPTEPEEGPDVALYVDELVAIADERQRMLIRRALFHGQGLRVLAVYEA